MQAAPLAAYFIHKTTSSLPTQSQQLPRELQLDIMRVVCEGSGGGQAVWGGGGGGGREVLSLCMSLTERCPPQCCHDGFHRSCGGVF